ncbi:hypothetical protein YTPLAS18_17280 [Nitrospira sp.]|nr:hypothetical protein YTPLAS18_17280 [Nitrospira sp.]
MDSTQVFVAAYPWHGQYCIDNACLRVFRFTIAIDVYRNSWRRATREPEPVTIQCSADGFERMEC